MANYRNNNKHSFYPPGKTAGITLDAFLSLAKALSDDNRVRATAALQQGELCVCQIIELLDLAPSTVSKHMSILRQAGIVTSRKSGRWVYYSLCKSDQSGNASDFIILALEKVTNDETIKADTQKLIKIKAMDLDQLCNG